MEWYLWYSSTDEETRTGRTDMSGAHELRTWQLLRLSNSVREARTSAGVLGLSEVALALDAAYRAVEKHRELHKGATDDVLPLHT